MGPQPRAEARMLTLALPKSVFITELGPCSTWHIQNWPIWYKKNIISNEPGMRTYGHEHKQQQGLPIPHTTTTTHEHTEVRRTAEWRGIDVGSDRTTRDRVTRSPMADVAPLRPNKQPAPHPNNNCINTNHGANATTTPTPAEGSPRQPRAAHRRRLGHHGPWVMRQ